MKTAVSMFALLLGLALTGCTSSHQSLSSSETPSETSSYSISLDELPHYNATDNAVVVPEDHVIFESELESEYATVTIELTHTFVTTNASLYVWHTRSDASPLYPTNHTVATEADLGTWVTTTITADLTDATKLVFELLGEGTKVNAISILED